MLPTPGTPQPPRAFQTGGPSEAVSEGRHAPRNADAGSCCKSYVVCPTHGAQVPGRHGNRKQRA